MELNEKILGLNRAQVIEAATTFSNIITEGKPDAAAEKLSADVVVDPSGHIEDVEALSRIILLNAADDPEYAPIVAEVVDGTGQKQFILGGLEIVALAVVGIAALKIILNPISKKHTKIKQADGTVIETTETHDSTTGFLADVFKSLFGKGGA